MRQSIWDGLVPQDVAQRQIAWERGRRALQKRRMGWLLQDIGKSEGVSRERARQLILKAERVEEWTRAKGLPESPVERWMLAENWMPDFASECQMVALRKSIRERKRGEVVG